MSFIFTILLSLFSFAVIAQEENVELNKRFWSNFLEAKREGADHFVSLPREEKSNGSTSLLISKKGSAKTRFKVDGEKLVDMNTNIYFKDIIGNRKLNEDEVLPTPYDFLFLTKRNIRIRMEDYNANAATLKHKNELFEIRIDEIDLKNLKGNVYFTFLFSKKEEQVELDKEASMIGLDKFLEEIKKCADLMDFNCLAQLYEFPQEVNRGEFYKKMITEALRESFQRRLIFESEKLCEVYRSTREGSDEDNRISNMIKISSKEELSQVWSSLREVLDMNLAKNYVTFKGFSLKDKYSRVVLFKKLRSKARCGNYIEGRLKFGRINGRWKILEIKMENAFQPIW